MAKAASRGQIGFVGERLGYLLHRVDLQNMQLLRDRLADAGLTPARATALDFVHENPGCSQSDLGNALGINRSSVMEVVDSLANLGAIERRSALDRRTNALFLNEKGGQLHKQFSAISKEVDDVIAASLSDAERVAIIDIISKILNNFESGK